MRLSVLRTGYSICSCGALCEAAAPDCFAQVLRYLLHTQVNNLHSSAKTHQQVLRLLFGKAFFGSNMAQKPELRRVPFHNPEDVIKVVEEDGCCIATGFTSLENLQKVNSDVEPYLSRSKSQAVEVEVLYSLFSSPFRLGSSSFPLPVGRVLSFYLVPFLPLYLSTLSCPSVPLRLYPSPQPRPQPPRNTPY